MNLEPVVDYLVANSVGIKGQSVFGYSMPATCKDGVLVTANSPIPLHPYQKGRADGTIQIIVRGNSSDSVRSRAKIISDLLHKEGLQLTGVKILKIYPQSEPLVYPRAEGGLLEASVNFNLTYVN